MTHAAIVVNRASDWCIVAPPGASDPTLLAAAELRDTVERMTTVELPIVEATQARPAIVLAETDELAEDAFRIAVTADRVDVSGCGRGVLYGVYALLEQLGCRFIVPGDDCVPTVEGIKLPCGTREEAPSVWWRMVRMIDCPEGVDTADWFRGQLDWCAKNRISRIQVSRGWIGTPTYMDRPPYTSDRVLGEIGRYAMQRGIGIYIGGHSFFHWVPPAVYFDEHPEYYSEIDGERKPVQLCVTNPEVERVMAERIVAFLDAHPEIGGVGVGPMDGDQWCDCPECRKADEPVTMAGGPFNKLQSRSRSLYAFIDRVGNRVAEKHPDRWLFCFAYVHYSEPPEGSRFTAPNVAIDFTWYWNCATHAVDDPSCDTAAYFMNTMRLWSECLEGKLPIFVADYHYGMSAWDLLPWPALRLCARNWQAAVPLGMQGYAFQYYKADTVTYRITTWLWSRYMWNIENAGRWQELLAQACNAYFGEASGARVVDYLLLWERAAQDFDGHLLPSVGKFLLQLIDESTREQLEGIAGDIRRLPASPHLRGRISQFLWQHDLFASTWDTMRACAEAERLAQAACPDEAAGQWRKALNLGRHALSFWPENPGMLRHARNVVRQAQQALGEQSREDELDADDQVAAEMIDKVSG